MQSLVTMRGMRDSPTRRGNQFAQSAHDRMMSRKPAARMNERRMTAAGGWGGWGVAFDMRG